MTTPPPMPPRELFVYSLQDPTLGEFHALTFLSTAEAERFGGLPGAAILARMKDPQGGLDEANLEWNGAFLELLHEVVKTTFPTLPELAEVTLGPEATHLYVHVTRPGRTARSEEPADVIGRFGLKDGRLDPAAYEAHPGFLPVTPEGMFIMHPDLERALLATFEPGGASAN